MLVSKVQVHQYRIYDVLNTGKDGQYSKVRPNTFQIPPQTLH